MEGEKSIDNMPRLEYQVQRRAFFLASSGLGVHDSWKKFKYLVATTVELIENERHYGLLLVVP